MRIAAEHDLDWSAIDDLELVDRTLRGCTQSFDVLVARFRPRLLQLLLARCNGSYQDAEDVSQEALTRAYRELSRFDPQYRFSTWLFTIALRIASDHRRRWKRTPWTSLEPHHAPAAEASVQDAVELRDQAENLWHIARRLLGHAQYTAMWLKYGEDLSVGEIARIMRRTHIGVRVLLHRARVQMTNALVPMGNTMESEV